MSEVAAQMPRYKCHKEVWALKIKEIRRAMPSWRGTSCRCLRASRSTTTTCVARFQMIACTTSKETATHD